MPMPTMGGPLNMGGGGGALYAPTGGAYCIAGGGPLYPIGAIGCGRGCTIGCG